MSSPPCLGPSFDCLCDYDAEGDTVYTVGSRYLTLVCLFIQEDDEDEDSSSGVSDSDVLLQDGYERAETRPILSVREYPVHAFPCVRLLLRRQCSSGLPFHFTLIPHAPIPKSSALAR